MAKSSHGSWRRFSCSVGIACLLALSPFAGAALAAQAPSTAASIIGQVTDESGGVLPGVTVTATGPALQVPQVTSITSEQGDYRLTPLPIGTYTVVYELAGFQGIRRENVVLTAGFVAKFDVVLKVGSLAETVTVSGASPVVDVTTTATVAHLTKDTLETVPNGHLGFISVLGMVPGVRAQLDSGGSLVEQGSTGISYTVFGQSNEGWLTLEGVMVGGPKRGQTGQSFDYASLEESRVQTIGAGADMPSPGIQVVGIVKSGGNEFHGSGVYTQTNSRLQNNNLDDKLRALGINGGGNIINRLYTAGDVGGRIVRNKLWFYEGANRRVHHNYLTNLYKADGSQDDPYENMSFINTKVSYQASPANRLTFFHQLDLVDRITIGALGPFDPWESRSLQKWHNNTAKIEWQTVVGSSLTTSVQYGYFVWDSLQFSPLPLVPSTYDVFTQLNTGSNWGKHLEHVREYNNHMRGTLNWYRPDRMGNHQFTTGFDYLLPTINRARGARGAALDYQLVFNSGVPFELYTDNFPVNPFTASHYLGIYGEDRWALSRQLTLTLGLRFAHDNGFVPAQCREAGVFIEAGCFPAVQFKIWNTFAPRAQAAWDVMGTGKSVIKGGWARFDHQRLLDPEVLGANKLAPELRTWLWHDLNNNRLYEPGEVNLDPNGSDFVTVSGAGGTAGGSPSYAVPNPNEKEPKQDQFSLAYEQELIPNLGVRVTGLYARSYNLYRLTNTKRPDDVINSIAITKPDPGLDGRAGTADDPGTNLTYYEFPTSYVGLQFLQGMLVNDPRNVAKFKSYEVALTKRLSRGWQAMASYSATLKNIPFGSVDPVATGLNAEFNTADNTWTKIAKISGSYLFPAGVNVSANLEARSGNPWQRTVLVTGGKTIPSLVMNAEPVGTRELPTITLLDFRGDKKFNLGGGKRIGVRANLYNALNANTVTAVTNRSGGNFGKITQIVQARVLEFGASLDF